VPACVAGGVGDCGGGIVQTVAGPQAPEWAYYVGAYYVVGCSQELTFSSPAHGITPRCASSCCKACA
jgi:hypothetical protein